MKLRNWFLIGVGIIAGFTAPALADLTYTQGAGTTIFDFVCFTTKHCSAHVTIDSTGTEVLPATHSDMTTLTSAVNAAIPAGTNLIGDVNVRQGGTALSATNPSPVAPNAYPVGATPITASATGTTAATTATLAGAASKTTYICSLSVRANATANTNVTNTVTGVITGTLSRAMWIPANTAGLGVDEQIYTPCVPASGTNTAIAVVSGAPGTGGVVTVNATGYQQ